LPDGYVQVRDHQFSRSPTGIILEHDLVMARSLGRRLHPHERVHHLNGIRHDNRHENLELWTVAHPVGQRVEDLIGFCLAFLGQYRPELLK
jgi:hypothetical protein